MERGVNLSTFRPYDVNWQRDQWSRADVLWDLETLTAEEEASIQSLLLGALLELSESSAGNREALARHISVFKESLKCSAEKTALIERLFSYLFEVIDVHGKAIARLEMLGADTDEFQIPSFEV